MLDTTIIQIAFYYIDNVKVEEQSFFSLYPNPAAREVTLKDEAAINSTADIAIFDNTGRFLRTLHVNFNQQEAKISLYGLRPGLYYLNILTSKSHQVLKLGVDE
jgi:hypothetical protein